jgi:hypothetical protein
MTVCTSFPTGTHPMLTITSKIWYCTDRPDHSLHIYKEYHSVCPLAGIVTLPPPLSPASVPLPPEAKGGAHTPAGEGLGESQFRRLEKSLALFLLCGPDLL